MNRSFWTGTAEPVSFPKLHGELDVDVAIVGGGITGITAAQVLSRAGRRVAVIEALRIGIGTTAHSTGNLHTVVDEYLYTVRSKWNDQTLQAVVSSRQQTIDFVEQTVAEHGIDCGFARRPHYLFATEPSQEREMEKEFDAATAGGLRASIVEDFPLHFGLRRALRVEDQAQFHPLRYVLGVAKAIESETCRIFEQSKAIEIDAKGNFIRTAEGLVRASQIILATHTPKGFHLVQTELGPYREYGLAARLNDEKYPVGIFWSFEQPHHSIRSFIADGTPHLIVIGEKHKVGQHDNEEDYYGKLEAYTREHFDVASIEYRWSGQHYKPADAIPFIGQSGTTENLYIATGFSTSGLLYGPLAAQIISDDILGRANEWRDVYRANRFTPVKSAKDFTKENLNVAGQYVKDYLLRAELQDVCQVTPGEGEIVSVGGEKLAVYRNESGQWTALSPVCPHMGCIVHWNRHEKSWDCPCHGSRFKPEGEVIEGPSIAPLNPKEIRD